ncbi:MAG: phosphatidylserine/phosphatidylglycerophosphate/cardiolipin synthase family protein [Deltaproteobacteria bacterium]|nr:phosphatidylserine/phosphatidylglycerophosphate/cardiolipin synthase family protein [Deltaproteobacteria bacterium]
MGNSGSWRWRVLAAATALMLACGAPQRTREQAARELVDFVAGTSVFGPATEFVPSDLPEVRATGLFPVRPAAQCEIAMLAGGEDSFATRMHLLAVARRSIRIQALIFTGDESGLRVAEVLKQKRQQGLDVRVIVDAASNVSLQTQWMYFDLKQHGVEVEGYEALGLQLVNEIPIPFVSSHQDPNKRYHEKVWIVDAGTPDAQAVIGGLNIANEYFRVDPTNVPRYWRDQDVVVRGAVVADLTTMFDRNVAHFKQQKADRGGLTDVAWDAARAIMGRTGKPAIAFEQRAELQRTVAALEARPAARDHEPARCRWFQSRPRLHESYIQQAHLKLLATARREVLIANAYFVPTPSIKLALQRAALRCVRVVVLTNGAETSDTPGVSLLGRGHYQDLLDVNATPQVKACPNRDAGLEVWEWRGRKAGEAKATQGLMHSKYVVVDRRLSLVGSYNLDPRSERLNSESALVYEHRGLSEQLARIFLDQDLASSRRISAAEAARFERPATIFARFKKQLAGLFEDQL